MNSNGDIISLMDYDGRIIGYPLVILSIYIYMIIWGGSIHGGTPISYIRIFPCRPSIWNPPKKAMEIMAAENSAGKVGI